jgi:hypothetical protein
MVSVTFELIVAVAVYPDVNVSDNTVIDDDMILFAFPLVPTPSNITSSTDVGTLALSATPEALPQFVIPPEL